MSETDRISASPAAAPSLERVECAVIGAGVIGLAVARRLARAGIEVVVLEAAETIGGQTSSRNSEVIHAGIYYPGGSLKARACVAGREALYRYCEDHGVGHRRCGKIIVATAETQLAELAALKERAAGNGGRRPVLAERRRGRPAGARGLLRRRPCSRRPRGSSIRTA